MTKSAYWLSGALVLVLGTAGIATAKGGPGMMGDNGAGLDTMFEQFDADKDGKITQAEIDAAKAARFAAADTDADGFLSPEELTAYADKMRAERETQMRAARTTRMLTELDTDKDGKLSADELSAARGPDMMIDRLDGDKDGAITREEIAAARSQMMGMGRHGGDDDDRRGRGHDRGHDRGHERGHGRDGGDDSRAPWWLR